MGAHGPIRLLNRGRNNLTRTAGADDRGTSLETIGALRTEGNSEGGRNGAGGDEGQKKRRFKHEIPNQLLSEDLAALLAKL
jgi:hypothetical protein